MIYCYKTRYMITDGDVEELHKFAKKICVGKSHFLDRGKGFYYERLTEKMRQRAVEHGAIMIEHEDIFVILRAIAERSKCKK